MYYFTEITRSNIDEYLNKYELIICKIRNSRIKAKQIAILEIVFSQINNEILFIKNGPLGDIRGIVSFLCPKKNLILFKERLNHLGYCESFYILDFENLSNEKIINLNSINPLVWKGRAFTVRQFYNQDENIFIQQSPHVREFRIAYSDGETKTICGYRGDGSELGKRALPVEDARCMVNLSIPIKNKRMIDPFAGGGGIIYLHKYIEPGGIMTSIDIDPVLKAGLEYYGASHHVMDAKEINFPENSFDSVITEVPFSVQSTDTITKVLKNLDKCLSKNGIYIIMCKKDQGKDIEKIMIELGNFSLFNHEIDRKGIDVEIQIWHKNKELIDKMGNFLSVLKKIY